MGGGVGAELELVRHGDLVAELALGEVLALDVELGAVDGADGAVGQVERVLRLRVFGEVVVGFELVQEFGLGDDVVARLVFLEHLAFPFQAAGDHGLCGLVVLVGEGDGVDVAIGCVGVDENVVVALDKTVPFEVGRNLLGFGESVGVQCFLVLGLLIENLNQLIHTLLYRSDNVSFE